MERVDGRCSGLLLDAYHDALRAAVQPMLLQIQRLLLGELAC